MRHFILAAFAFLLLSTVPSWAGEPCVPDCPNDTWTGPVVRTYNLVGLGCTVQVEFWYRIACTNNYDVSLTSIKTIAGNCGTSMPAVYDAIMQAIISENIMGFPPGDGECKDNYRSTSGGCWNTDGDLWFPCSESVCCLTGYQVCQDNGVRTITKIYNSFPDTDCNVPQTNCHAICQ